MTIGLLRSVGTCCMLAVSLISTQVMAHTHLVDSDPLDGVTLASAPERITLRYSKPLEIRYSTFSLHSLGDEPDTFPEAANVITTGSASIENGNRTVILPIETLLPSGRYVLRWEVLATDGHTSRGVVRFLFTE